MSNELSGQGVVWVHWGSHVPAELWKSVASVKALGLSTCLIVEHSHLSYPEVDLIRQFKPLKRSCQDRARAIIDLSPFELTLQLDTDTIVVDDIQYGFDSAIRHGIACCIAPASYANRWHGMGEKYPLDLLQYNCGVLFLNLGNEVVRNFMNCWDAYLDLPLSRFQDQDQPAFSAAIYDMRIAPFVLSPNWNFRPNFGPQTLFGPLKIWHSKSLLPKHILGRDEFWSVQPKVSG